MKSLIFGMQMTWQADSNHRALQEPIHVIQDLNMYTYGLIYIVRERERENRLNTRNLELNFQIHIYSIT